MSIVSLVLILLIFGFVCWLVTTAPIPIHPWFKSAILGILFIAIVIWLLNSLGLGTGINVRLK